MIKRATTKPQRIKKTSGTPLAFVSVSGLIYMLVREDKKTTSSLALLSSSNGVDFLPTDKKVSLGYNPRKKEKIKDCKNFSISSTPTSFIMTYTRVGKTKGADIIVVAKSIDLFNWTVKSEIPAGESRRATVIYDKPLNLFMLYRDGLFVRNQSTVTLHSWKKESSLLFTSRHGNFDSEEISIVGSVETTEGLLVMYDASVREGSKTLLQLGAVIFDVNNPNQPIWRSQVPVWQGLVDANKKVLPIAPVGFVPLGKSFIFYWLTADGGLIVVKIHAVFKEVEDARFHPKIMSRFHNNPVISPIAHSAWENEGTFNPAVIEDDEGTVHLLYRAIGSDGVSRIGYAQSKDGMSFTKRFPYPVFEPARGYGMPDPNTVMGPLAYNPYIYTSGGGWGGSEDPRAVLIDKTVYMLYVAFEGWNSMRIALTSISLDDFKNHRWNWRKPRLISSAENRSKNWLLFPEKINGKYAIIHSISPKVLVEYIDDIDSFDEVIFSPRPEGPQPGRKNSWDTYLKGSGPPPIMTELGWLLLYHALEKSDTSKYRLGAMILDKNDPTKVLYRSAHPILSPDMHYENDGKPGVVYASGAIIRGKDLYVYYGGGDKVVCVATTPLDKFLKYMVTGNEKIYQLKSA